MAKEDNENNENQICIHIFSASATLVGVCLTVIGLFKIIEGLKSISVIGDDLLAVDALLFIISCILSYFALRSRTAENRRKLEKIADIVFFTGLIFMGIVCGLVAYYLI